MNKEALDKKEQVLRTALGQAQVQYEQTGAIVNKIIGGIEMLNELRNEYFKEEKKEKADVSTTRENLERSQRTVLREV